MSNPIETTEADLREAGVPIYTAGNREFELSVATPNFLYRYHRPTWVVRPRNDKDVATTVGFANTMGERITVKNGGHSYAGFSNANGGILVDLCNMKAVKIEDNTEEDTKVMIMSGGALWGDAYHELAAGKHDDGFIVNGGRCPLVGVSGFLLGGGFGPFSRSVGMGMDQLVEVDVVTAEGEIVTVGENDSPEDNKGKLFWALRGCGGGNYGIVTRLKIRVKKLRDPWVIAGRLTWNVTKEKLQYFKMLMFEFYTGCWENYLTIDTTWECDLSKSSDSRPFSTRFIAYYDGREAAFKNEINSKMSTDASVLAELLYPDPSSRPVDPNEYFKYRQSFKEQLIRRSLAEKSTMFFHETLWAQWSEETRRSLPTDRAYTLYSSWIIKNDDGRKIQTITDIISERIQRFRVKFTGERGTFGVTWIHVGGEISKKQAKDTPYPWRQGDFCVYILVRWHEKWLVKEMGTFFDECKDKLKQYSIEGKASYVNFPDRCLSNWSEAYYGENLQELKLIHQRWDPNNRHVLRFPQNIGRQDSTLRDPEGVEGAPGGSRGGFQRGALPSGEDVRREWTKDWEDFQLPSHSYEDYVSQGEQLPRC
ncbi:hypothetical protein EV426DRAFT_622940 [Tirmania nivea]|nr:hypothetical protein EV426DRAFT_622940 [Tirmania nivea]